MNPLNSSELSEQTWELLLEVMSQGERHQLNSTILTPYHTQLLTILAKHTAAARIDELNWLLPQIAHLPNDITGVREYVANRRLELQATNPEESNHAKTTI